MPKVLCRAHSKQTGLPCKQPPSPGRELCRFHGGRNPRGIAHRNWQGRGYSLDLPTRLADRFRQALADPALLELRSEVALVDARLGELLADLRDTPDAARDLATWEGVTALIEQRRKLVETERRREETLQLSLSAAQALAFVSAVQVAITELIVDRQVRARLAERIEVLVMRPAPSEGTADA